MELIDELFSFYAPVLSREGFYMKYQKKDQSVVVWSFLAVLFGNTQLDTLKLANSDILASLSDGFFDKLLHCLRVI